MAWEFNRTTPVFMQIAGRLRSEILGGKYEANTQIPSVRQLAFEASVNPNTMQKALTKLEEDGLLYTRGTVGRFVTSDQAVLQRARELSKREILHDLLEQTKALGITGEELIRYIREEETR